MSQRRELAEAWQALRDRNPPNYMEELCRLRLAGGSGAGTAIYALRHHDCLVEALSRLHSTLERLAVNHTDLLTSDDHVALMAAAALLNRLTPNP